MIRVPQAWAGIGSRDIPDWVQDMQMQLGRVLYDLGVGLTSGGADGSDEAFHEGAKLSSRYEEIGVEIYLAGLNFEKYRHDPTRGFYQADKFANYEHACELAKDARGTWHGLGEGGIKLHCRNPYQILRQDLATPVSRVICYAEPLRDGLAVKGGTNTAYQIARAYRIPIINLYTPEGFEQAENFLRKHLNK